LHASSVRSDLLPHADPDCTSPCLLSARLALSSSAPVESRDIQKEPVEHKMQLAIAQDPNSHAANAALARQIANKQSGGTAVNHIFSAGYGWEEPVKHSGAGPTFVVKAPWD